MESVLFRYGQQISKGGLAVKGYVVTGGIRSGGWELPEERSMMQWEE